MAKRLPDPSEPYSVRAVHRDELDVDKLSELLIRFALQRAEQARIEHAGASDPIALHTPGRMRHRE